MTKDKCCGTCKYHHYSGDWDDWVCANPDSDNCSDYTMYNDSCEDWGSREDPTD